MSKFRRRPNFFAAVKGPILAASLALPLTLLSAQSTFAEEKPFTSMTIAPDDPEACRLPKPPTDLAETAYLRNGYHAILRILIAEDALAAQSCDCRIDQTSWDMALNALPRFRTSDSPRLPFKVLDLFAQADALEAELAEFCAEIDTE